MPGPAPTRLTGTRDSRLGSGCWRSPLMQYDRGRRPVPSNEPFSDSLEAETLCSSPIGPHLRHKWSSEQTQTLGAGSLTAGACLLPINQRQTTARAPVLDQYAVGAHGSTGRPLANRRCMAHHMRLDRPPPCTSPPAKAQLTHPLLDLLCAVRLAYAHGRHHGTAAPVSNPCFRCREAASPVRGILQPVSALCPAGTLPACVRLSNRRQNHSWRHRRRASWQDPGPVAKA